MRDSVESFRRCAGLLALVPGFHAQCRIDPLGRGAVISTHDQVLGGPTGQVFQGCTFPADPQYTPAIQDAALRVSGVLAGRGHWRGSGWTSFR